MPNLQYADAIIVGAGPAGSITALLLARAGHHILLLDRQRFPRAKPCGDCLSAGTTRVLHRIGVLDAVLAEKPAHLTGWRIVSPGGHEFAAGFHDATTEPDTRTTALSIPREHLDHALARAAQRAGAKFLTGIRVTDPLLGTDGRVVGVRARGADGQPITLQAPLVVAADGLRSTLARRLGAVRRAPRLRKLSLTAHLHGIQDLGNGGEMHVIDGACAGVAPVTTPEPDTDDGTRLCNLTLVVYGDRFARDVARDTRTFFREMIRRFPALGHRIDTGPVTTLLASGPFDWPTRRITGDGFALVGDAAGYFDPFTGQGIHHAITGAEILAEVADAALRTGDLSAKRLRPYSRGHAAMIRGAHAVQYLIETVISRPRLADLAIRRLARNPAAAEALVAVTADLRPARSLLSSTLALTLLSSR